MQAIEKTTMIGRNNVLESSTSFQASFMLSGEPYQNMSLISTNAHNPSSGSIRPKLNFISS